MRVAVSPQVGKVSILSPVQTVWLSIRAILKSFTISSTNYFPAVFPPLAGLFKVGLCRMGCYKPFQVYPEQRLVSSFPCLYYICYN